MLRANFHFQKIFLISVFLEVQPLESFLIRGRVLFGDFRLEAFHRRGLDSPSHAVDSDYLRDPGKAASPIRIQSFNTPIMFAVQFRSIIPVQ